MSLKELVGQHLDEQDEIKLRALLQDMRQNPENFVGTYKDSVHPEHIGILFFPFMINAQFGLDIYMVTKTDHCEIASKKLEDGGYQSFRSNDVNFIPWSDVDTYLNEFNSN